MITRLISCLTISVAFAACGSMNGGSHSPEASPGTPVLRDNVPMMRVLQSDDWEELDHLWGINTPDRHIYVQEPGFRLRKKIGFIGGGGDPTPKCVEYGGRLAIVVQTVEVLGKKGQEIHFLQGAGDCSR